MTCKDILTTLNSVLPNSELSVEADLLLDENNDMLFRILFTTNEATFILLSFQVCLNKKDLKAAVTALQSNVGLPVETKDIQEFVKRRNICLLPCLREYNKTSTDYGKLAELYYDTRGTIMGNRFG